MPGVVTVSPVTVRMPVRVPMRMLVIPVNVAVLGVLLMTVGMPIHPHHSTRTTILPHPPSWSIGSRGAFNRSMQHHLGTNLFKGGVYDPTETVETFSCGKG